MLRKIAVGLAAMGALNAAQVNALGLGEVTVHSALNQPLNAEIDLLQIRDLTTSQIIAGLADADEFYLAGVKPTSVLSDLSFELQLTNSGGRLLLKTRQPIREPFLNFLVEVNWPTGRLVKEYTLLLDPPVFTAQDLAPKVKPVMPVAKAAPFTVAKTPASVSQSTPVAAAPNVAPMGASQYRVDAHDTLWNIALKTRPDRSITPQQMMLAIQKHNPDAFINNNINRLRSGVVLEIPSREEIAAMESANPVLEVQRQNSAWRSSGAGDMAAPKSEQMDASTAQSKSGSVAPKDESQLRIAVKDKEVVEPAKPEAAETVGSDTTTVKSAPDAMADSELAAKNRELEEQLVVTLEGLDKVERDNAELFARLERISEQMESMQRLMVLKDQQLAELQNRQPPVQQVAPAAVEPVQNDGADPGSMLRSPAVMGGLGAGVLALLGGLFWFMRKRKQDAAAEEQAVEDALAMLDAQESGVPAKSEDLLAQAAVAAAVSELDAVATGSEVDDADLSVVEDPNDPFNAVSDADVNEFDALDDLDIEGVLDMDLKIDEPVTDDMDFDQFSESLLSDDEFDLSVDTQPDVLAADADEEVLNSTQTDQDESLLDELDMVLGEVAGADSMAAAEPVLDEMDDLDALLNGEGADALTLGAGEAEAEPVADAAAALEDDLDAILADHAAGGDEVVPEVATAVEAEQEPTTELDELDRLLAEDDMIHGEELGIVDDAKAESLVLDRVEPIQHDEESLDDDRIEAMLAGVGEEMAPAASESELQQDLADEIDFDGLSAFSLEDEVVAEASEPAVEEMLAPELEEVVKADELSAPEEVAELAVGEDDDLLMGELLTEEPESAPMPTAKPVSLVGLELDEELEFSNPEADALLDGLPTADEDAFDFDALAAELEQNELSPSATADEPSVAGLQLEDELDQVADEDLESELSLMLEQEGNDIALDESDELAGFDDALDYLEDADEVGTKLDLARAYVDMDDAEGAADILAEVLREGSEEQIAEAQKLLDSLKS